MSMEVYIECVVFNNLFIDALLVYLACLTAKIHTSVLKILAASAFGTAFAVVSPFLQGGYLVLLKCCASMIMCLPFLSKSSPKVYFKVFIWLLFFTAMFGGAVLWLFNLGQYSAISALSLTNGWVSGISAACGILAVFTVKKTIYKITEIRRNKECVCNVLVQFRDKNISVLGLWDSGNRLYFKSNCPVIIVDKQVAGELNFEGRAVGEIKARTVSGNTAMPVVKIDSVTVERKGAIQKFFNVFACVAEHKLDDYRIILHSEM